MNTAINKRFKIIVEDLLQRKIVKSQTELANIYGCDKSFIGQMMRGESPVPLEWIILLLESYNVSADYILGNCNPKYVNEKSSTTMLLNEPKATYGNELEIKIKSLQNELASKDETIQTQKLLINTLMGKTSAKAS